MTSIICLPVYSTFRRKHRDAIPMFIYIKGRLCQMHTWSHWPGILDETWALDLQKGMIQRLIWNVRAPYWALESKCTLVNIFKLINCKMCPGI
jgi:hypothetical protein